MTSASELRVKIFADGADLKSIEELAANPLVRGFTTNPTLMRAAGVEDYATFAKRAIETCGGRPISLEVVADDLAEMADQARELASWGDNVFVKIPVTDTQGRPTTGLLRRLADDGVRLNVTAVMTVDQVRVVAPIVARAPQSFVSLFAGRVADTGRDPMPIMTAAVEALRAYPTVELIWASPRELLNIFQADAIGCDVITVTRDLLKKLDLVGKDLQEYSLETVRMFYEDGRKSGFTIPIREGAIRR